MDIAFLEGAPLYRGDEPALLFYALADGERIPCTISAEALMDHFGAASSRVDDLLHAFDTHRADIEGAAEQLLTSVGRTPVKLRSGYFRFSDGTAALHPHRDWKLHDDAHPADNAAPRERSAHR